MMTMKDVATDFAAAFVQLLLYLRSAHNFSFASCNAPKNVSGGLYLLEPCAGWEWD